MLSFTNRFPHSPSHALVAVKSFETCSSSFMINWHNRQSIFILGLALVFLIFLFGRIVFLQIETRSSTEQERIQKLAAPDPFSLIHIKAGAAFVWDMREGKAVYGFNEYAQLPLASLTKIMTALLAVEQAGESEVATISKDAILKEGDHGFLVGERWRLQDLIDATLITSSNDGAYALASVFIAPQKNEHMSREEILTHAMNEKARQIGLHQTFFADEAGLDVSLGFSGAYGSARDVAQLLSYVLVHHPSLMEATSKLLLTTHSLDGTAHNLENTNKFVETFPGVVASKTGTTDLAGANVALVFEAGPMRPIVVVVLGSTPDERFSDAEQLMWATLKKFQVQNSTNY